MAADLAPPTLARLALDLAHKTDQELRDLIMTEREQGRAFGPNADAARYLLMLRTGEAA